MATPNIDRRQHERFALQPMYSRVAVRLLDADSLTFDFEGHGWDIAEGGISFELDRAIAPGTPIVMQIDLPLDSDGNPPGLGPGRSVFVFANVVWLTEDDGVGPARMAAAFTRFAREGDKERLIREFCSGRYVRAA
ncbi:MAG: PilZ domain-containing protein [Planctomycetota bacterium]